MTSGSLADFKTIIVTRPHGQSPDLVSKMQTALGDSPLVEHLPLIRIEPLDYTPKPADIANHIIFISSNAVKHFADKPHARALIANSTIYAIGENTASSVKQHLERKAHYPQKMNAEGLLALPELTNVMGQQWLIIKGQGGRVILRETLRTRGAKVSELDVYRRCLPDLSEQKVIQSHSQTNPLWVLSSGEALNNLHRVLGLSSDSKHNTKVIVTSDRLVNEATQKGFAIVTQSAGAAEEQLVQCAKSFFRNQE